MILLKVNVIPTYTGASAVPVNTLEPIPAVNSREETYTEGELVSVKTELLLVVDIPLGAVTG